ncbi:MAG: transcription termination/antitermination protein NusG [bacterium]|nr:transcription termination/antitermination protein NusG [bacterium]
MEDQAQVLVEENEIESEISENHPGASWYVIHTYSGHENKVAITLKQRITSMALEEKVFNILVPTQEKIVISEGKKRTVEEKLFPGYILINMILSDETWHAVRSTSGVTGFVGTGDKPSPLPEKEVKSIIKFMKMEAPKFEAKFNLGDGIKIIDGPFSDFIGKVDALDDEKGKVTVLVSVFGRETPVELDFLQVSPL